MERKTGIPFPCSFPIKVMGPNIEAFPPAVLAVFEKYVEGGGLSCSRQLSSGGKYLSLTVTFMARDQEQLDAIYQELKAEELVLVAF